MPHPTHGFEWYLEMLSKAGTPEDLHERSLKRLKECGIQSRKDLVKAHLSRRRNGRDFGLADLEIPTEHRDNLIAILKKPSLPADHQETMVCNSLSSFVYTPAGEDTDAIARFKERHKPLLFLHAQCPETSQKYICCVVNPSGRLCLFVAFAGTHTGPDRTTNLSLSPVSEPKLGGKVHGGFLERCRCLKFQFIHRMVEHFGCDAIIFTGHSLGGAVSHLSCLSAKRLEEFARLEIRICSVVFGAPLCVCEQVAKDVARQGWTDSFVNIVNLDDPVPRLLNLTESLAELCRSGSELLGDAADIVKQVVSCLMGSEGVVTLLTKFFMTDALSSRLKQLIEHPASRRLAKMVDVYRSIGVYIFIESSHDDQYECSWSEGLDVLRHLGPAKLLNDRVSLSGFTSDSIRRHDIDSYQVVLRAVADFLDVDVAPAVADFLDVGVAPALERLGSFLSEGSGTSGTNPDLTVQVHCVKVCLDEEGQSVVYGVVGKNLDLLGKAGIELDCDGQYVAATATSMLLQTDTALKLHQEGVQQADKLKLSKRLRFRPDVGQSIDYDLHAHDFVTDTAALTAVAADEELCFDKKLIRRMMKLAFLAEHYLGNTKLMELVCQLDSLGPGGSFGLAQHLMKAKRDPAEALCLIAEGEDAHAMIAEVHDMICPPGGLQLASTSKWWARGIFTVAGFAAIGLSMWWSGGLSLLVPAIFPSTGGYLSATCSISATAGIHYMLSDDRLPGQYNTMLDVYLEESGLTIKESPELLVATEFAKEKILLGRVEAAKREKRSVWKGRFADLRPSALKKIDSTLDAIKIIHDSKGVASVPMVFISGPANGGKTTLVSQLLMSPEVAHGAGYNIESRTTQVQARVWGEGAFVIDTPGLDAAQKDLMRKFEAGTCTAKAYVYIRTFQGPEQQDDLRNLLVTLDQASSQKPHILILLNQVIDRRRQADGTELSVDELMDIKHSFLSNLKDEYEKKRTSQYRGTKMESFLARYFSGRFSNVLVRFADLSRSREAIKSVAPDLEDHILDARGVAEWCQNVLDPKRTNSSLDRSVNDIDWTRWAMQRRAYEEEWRKEQAAQTARGAM
ncbi:CRYZ [Symbiodinium sp. CCMP2456]|nr:CRYZ [Symbiodinium sp. CCMP2456]